MIKAFTGLLVCGLAAGMATNSLAVSTVGPPPASADIVINGHAFRMNLQLVNGLYVIANQTFTDPVSGASVLVGSTANPDPSIVYSFSASNPSGGPIPFAFDEIIPLITPVPAGSKIITSVGYTLTDDISGDGVTLTPFVTSPFISGFSQTPTGDGIDLGAPLDIGTAFSGSGALQSFTTSFSATGPSPFGFSALDVHLSFLLTGGGDSAGITGAVGVIAVPEPGTVALLVGLGGSGSVFALRRKRRA